ncbi:hypothetical protein CLIB1423_20S00540 [[Candida] railenensis]|uniref:Uncharacterized protein n=1 Tax=[Candida] railenensis TaxID=45579 RepID=A0A9P0QU14_9ASCO|nr:hypothetical protein CLIB1423_20S00540 [[Candida] railenensis]
MKYNPIERNMEEEKMVKRRKVQPIKEMVSYMDPVEKLLAFANRTEDDFLNMQSSEEQEQQEHDEGVETTTPQFNIKRMMDDNLKLYYSQLRSPKTDTDNSFASLNIPENHGGENSYPNSNNVKSSSSNSSNANTTPVSAVPFFRTVNFNPKPASTYTFDEYLSYDEEECESPLSNPDSSIDSPLNSSSDSEDSPIMAKTKLSSPFSNFNFNKKMSFHYRRNDNLNLSLNQSSQPESMDVFKALNKRCILNGKASEMVSTGNLLINDFFL